MTISDRPSGPRRSRALVATAIGCVALAVLATGFIAVRPATSQGYAVDASPGHDPATGTAPPARPAAGPAGASSSPSPYPSTAVPPSTGGAFPGPSNTGVPAGIQLRPYAGPCAIAVPGTVIDGMSVDCPLTILAADVVIRRSKVYGRVSSAGTGSVRIEDSEIDDGVNKEPAVGHLNVSIYRTNIHGAAIAVSCDHNCVIQDSWLHGQYMPPGSDWHLDAFISNGGNHVTLTHNTLACDNPGSARGGCSGDGAIFGDFEPNSFYTFDRNLFVASPRVAYCTYSGSARAKPFGRQVDHIVYVGNVFERGANHKCGSYGPVAGFDPSRPGSQWSGNVWDDGKPLPLT